MRSKLVLVGVSLLAGVALGYPIGKMQRPRFEFLNAGGATGLAVWRCDTLTGHASLGVIYEQRRTWIDIPDTPLTQTDTSASPATPSH